MNRRGRRTRTPRIRWSARICGPSRWCSRFRRSSRPRYYSLQLIDAYTYNFAYVGSRTTGNGGGNYLLAGPSLEGEKPEGVDEVIRADTNLVLIAYRTQLFDRDDLDNVKSIQAGYQVQPLAALTDHAQPAPIPAIEFVKPLTPDQQKTSPEFLEILNFVLRYVPTLPAEKELRERFVNAFWSLTMYQLPTTMLVDPINRYLINSPMLESLAKIPTVGTPSTSITPLQARTRNPTGCPHPSDRTS